MKGARIRVLCAACLTPAILAWRDGDELGFAVLDKRLRGSAITFQRDADNPERVHKVIWVCQEKHCTGAPQFTREKMLAAVDALNRQHAESAPVDLRL